jgi:hypothetical protein
MNAKLKIFLNTLFWGFALWLFGYALGILFFIFVPQGMIGWYILPLGFVATLWVLFTSIKRETLGCYLGLGIIWTLMAVILDYVFIVLLLKSADYYKLDVLVYYALTFSLPVIVGWYKIRGKPKKAKIK